MAEEHLLVDHPRYETINMVGKGAYGFVVRAKDKQRNEEVAIKFLPRGRHIDKHVDREVLGHSRLLHPHVIEFKEVFLTDHYLAMVMEYAAGGDLLKYIREKKGISEDMARWFFQQLLVGLDYIHQKGVAIRDIKLENTLLDDNPWPIVKICDFGLCKREVVDSAPHSLIGTQPYLAPEVITQGDTRGGTYDGKKADIWSCGVLLYVMLVLHYPFERPGEDRNRNTMTIYQRIMNADYSIPRGKMSDECVDLIQKILVVDPQRRPDIKEIQQHRWYQKSLPKGAMDMNKDVEFQEDVQRETEIKAILEKARTV